MKRTLLVLAIVVAALMPKPAFAATHHVIAVCGLVPAGLVDQPGSWVLDNSLSNCSGSAQLISITASHVDLSLNGNLLDGDDGVCQDAVLISGAQTDITIHGGTVSDCANGVDALAGDHVTISDVLVKSTAAEGIKAGVDSVIKNNTVIGTVGDGINVTNTNQVVKNQVTDAGGWGIFALNDNVIKSNNIQSSTSDGMFVINNNQVTKNISKGNFGSGIEIDPGDNVVTGGKIISNVASNNSGDGITIVDPVDPAAPLFVKKNTVIGNVQQGIDANPAVPTPTGVGKNFARSNLLLPECDASLC